MVSFLLVTFGFQRFTNSSLTELIKTGICLGRAPGFRKKDVDRALNSAIIQVF
jgi:hypothetical protein